jgi:hypothetical protein
MANPTKLPVKVRGYVRDSGNKPITDGWLRVTADSTTPDYYTLPKVLITRRPATIPITDGYVEVDLVNSADYGSTYQFELGFTQQVDDGEGNPVPQEVVTDSFHAIVPRPIQANDGTFLPIDLVDLIPTGISTHDLDSSIQRVAEVIVTDPYLRSQAVTQFKIKGLFSPTQSYTYGDLVTIAGSPVQAWVCTSPAPTIPAATPNPNFFVRIT